MTTWNTRGIHTDDQVPHILGYRCRACGHVSEPGPAADGSAPGESRCAGCGLSVPEPGGPVRLAQVERHFEPLIWWDALAA